MIRERTAWGTSLFCDDIRFEVSGKVSVIGIYQNEMIFGAATEFPIVVPKFAILVRYLEIKKHFSDDLLLKVYWPGNEKELPPLVQTIKRSDFVQQNINSGFPLPEDSELVSALSVPLVFSPMHILQEGFIKVRMECGDTITKLGSLLLRKATDRDKNLFAA